MPKTLFLKAKIIFLGANIAAKLLGAAGGLTNLSKVYIESKP